MTYTLKDKKTYEKMGVEVFLYVHDKTKAQVVYVKTSDKNKTFGIGFKTPPTNSKGMAHIMEHSVLNGSKKYTTREPFMDMASSSLQTFLNAMTYPDKTVYPVSSENDKDFFNLTDVYLDAVFNPAVVNKKEILDQEGWHYEMDGDEITGISGVVYNEMKGALTDPDELVYNDIISHLYKNSPYQYESGGDPAEIYKLSYDEFVDFYKNHYHPSNAYIYFYGDLDIDFYLDHLDKEYLSNYDYKDFDYDIKVPDNYFDSVIESTYPASNASENSDYLAYGFLTKANPDTKYTLTLAILISALFHMDSSIIKKQINEEIDPESFYARLGYGVRSSLVLLAQKTDGKKLDRFVEIIEEGLKEASLGLNKESLKSAFSIFQYGQRDQLNSVSRGLNYFLMWSFNKSIFESFEIVNYLNELGELVETDYYENFIKENFINNPTRLIYIAKPSSTYNKKKQEDLEAYIDNLNKNISQEELQKIKNDLGKLEIHQNTADTEEQKASIPVLNIDDVPTKVDQTPRDLIDDKFIYHDMDTAGLIYTSLYFNIDHLDLRELQYLSLINDFMGSVDTSNMAYTQIDDVLFQHLASPNFSNSFINVNECDLARLEKVSFISTSKSFAKALELMKEFMLNSKFDNQKRILEILRMKKAYFASGMYDQGHILAINRANAHIDMATMLRDELSGIGSYLFLEEVIDQAKNNFDDFHDKITEIYAKLFSNDFEINITCSKDEFSKFKEIINTSFDKLEDKKDKVEIEFSPKSYKEAVMSDANVNYVGQSADIKKYGHNFEGKLVLASSILSNPYLYELIRAKAGAYGGGLTINKAGLLSAYSYRDPHILRTLETYRQIPSLTENIALSHRDFENQQISSMGTFLRPKSPQALADEDYARYKKENPVDHEKILADIKYAKLDEIKEYKKLFKAAIGEENICVFGNRESILEVKDKFDKIIDLKN